MRVYPPPTALLRPEVPMSPWLVLHQLSMALVAGGFLALVAALSLLLRSVDDAERKHHARLVVAMGKFVTPFMDLGVALGFVYWFVAYTPYGAAKIMACSPPFLHIMLAGGLVATGLSHAFRANARRASEAAEKGDHAAAKLKAGKAFLFGAIALGVVLLVSVASILKVPSGAMLNCVP